MQHAGRSKQIKLMTLTTTLILPSTHCRFLHLIEKRDASGDGKHPLIIFAPSDLLESATRPLERSADEPLLSVCYAVYV